MIIQTETAATRASRVAMAHAAFKSIVLPYPRQNLLMEALEELRLTGLETKGEPQDGLRLLAPSGSGKTWGAYRYMDWVAAQPGREPGKRPILYARQNTTGTRRSLPASILTAAGDDYSTVGNAETLLKRVYKLFEEEETELLIVDEINHLEEKAFGDDATDTLKAFLDEGKVPVVFLGTHKADDLFKRNKELNIRLVSPCSLPPLEWGDDDDRELFVEFAKQLDEAIVNKGILPIKAGLDEVWLAERLREASNGIIGQFCRIVREAVISVVRRNDKAIDYQDLIDAVDNWSIPFGFRTFNPLTSKPNS